MFNSKQMDPSLYARAGLDRLIKGDEVIVLKIPGVLLSHEDGLALLQRSASSSEDAERVACPICPHVCHGVDALETYLYVCATVPGDTSTSKPDDLALRLQQAATSRYSGAQAAVLEVTQALDGTSAARTPGWHYVVETDVLPEAEGDFNAWYEQEHLPGLAAVPGTVRAIRFRSTQESPRYHALYLLEKRATFGSEPWLKVRATEWSSRVRPNFINTKRTMFKILPPTGCPRIPTEP